MKYSLSKATISSHTPSCLYFTYSHLAGVGVEGEESVVGGTQHLCLRLKEVCHLIIFSVEDDSDNPTYDSDDPMIPIYDSDDPIYDSNYSDL